MSSFLMARLCSTSEEGLVGSRPLEETIQDGRPRRAAPVRDIVACRHDLWEGQVYLLFIFW